MQDWQWFSRSSCYRCYRFQSRCISFTQCNM